jgi:glycosyltransferase involved in cell wall biosynthesis
MRSDSEIYAIMHVRQDWFNALLKSVQLPIHLITPKLYIIKEDIGSSQSGYGAEGHHNYGISTNNVSDPDVLSKSFRVLLSKVDKYAVTNGSLFTGPKGALKLDFGYNCMVLEVSNDREKADIHYFNTFLIFKNGKSEKEYRSKILYYQLYRADLSDGTKIVASSWLNVHTSVTEGWGFSILEASSAGTPTVAYDVPGVRDAIEDKLNGIKVKDGDRKALLEATLTVLNDPKEWWSSSVKVAQKYSWDKSAQLWDKLIMEIIDGHHSE